MRKWPEPAVADSRMLDVQALVPGLRSLRAFSVMCYVPH
jgi:hypothetical protein